MNQKNTVYYYPLVNDCRCWMVAVNIILSDTEDTFLYINQCELAIWWHGCKYSNIKINKMETLLSIEARIAIVFATIEWLTIRLAIFTFSFPSVMISNLCRFCIGKNGVFGFSICIAPHSDCWIPIMYLKEHIFVIIDVIINTKKSISYPDV